MIERINTYLRERYKVEDGDKLLIAVSGGVDSMVLLHVLMVLEYDIGVVHVNHSTRDGESDEDQLFLEEYCKSKNVPIHVKKLSYELLKKGNFQENARAARYAFFDEVIKEYSYEYLVSAHHADDQWETFLMNLNRGSGLQGLKGIFEKNRHIIRPFLTITRAEIQDYQAENQVPYVEDSSNSEDTYLRNRIRHHVTPEIGKIFPNFINKVSTSTGILRNELYLINELVDYIKNEAVEHGKKKIKIKLKKIQEFKNADMLLYYILQPYGYDMQAVQSMLKTNRTGAIFQSKHYEVLRDRKHLILRKQDEAPIELNLSISSYGTYHEHDLDINIQLKEIDSVVNKHLLLNNQKLEFPLVIRNWRPGDKFQPSGMNGSYKKLKKFLTDMKLSRFEKESVLVLVQQDEIIQVIGLRTADGYICNEDIGTMITLSGHD